MATESEKLSAALDEIYRLRLLLASEARILEAHLELKSFPKSRREFAVKSVQRMRLGAMGKEFVLGSDQAKNEYRALTGTQTMTTPNWLESKGLS